MYAALASAVGLPGPVCQEYNVDYYGHDVLPLEGYIYSAEQCRSICLADTECFYYTFNQSTSSCYLKGIQALRGRRTSQWVCPPSKQSPPPFPHLPFSCRYTRDSYEASTHPRHVKNEGKRKRSRRTRGAGRRHRSICL